MKNSAAESVNNNKKQNQEVVDQSLYDFRDFNQPIKLSLNVNMYYAAVICCSTLHSM